MQRVLTIIGTRPEAIKLAPVVKALEQRASEIDSRVCVTAQHREMLDQVLDLFEISPHYDLDVMRERQSPSEVAASILGGLGPIFEKERPDWVLVQGDTTTVMASSIAAFYHRIKVGHVEAGLRTFDKWQPFPEEVNRRIAGVVADRHFAPTETARENLLRENVPADTVLVTGNTVIDALHQVANRALPAETRRELEDLGLREAMDPRSSQRRLILVTAHRRENHGRPIERICLALREIAEAYGAGIQIVYPVHLNPNIQDPVRRLLGDISNVTLVPPLSYLPLVHLMKRADFVLTDSGGLQEEAPGLGKPVLVLRETTERPEGVDAGTVKLVGTERATIVREARRLLDDRGAYEAMANAVNPYGDGQASARIVESILGVEPTAAERSADGMRRHLRTNGQPTDTEATIG